MMSISESNHEEDLDEDSDEYVPPNEDIPDEFIDLYKDEELRKTLVDLIHSVSDLDIFDFKEYPISIAIFVTMVLEALFTTYFIKRSTLRLKIKSIQGLLNEVWS